MVQASSCKGEGWGTRGRVARSGVLAHPEHQRSLYVGPFVLPCPWPRGLFDARGCRERHRDGLCWPLKTRVPSWFGWGSSFCCAVSLQSHPYLGTTELPQPALCTSAGPSDDTALPALSSPPQGTAPTKIQLQAKETNRPFFPCCFSCLPKKHNLPPK